MVSTMPRRNEKKPESTNTASIGKQYTTALKKDMIQPGILFTQRNSALETTLACVSAVVDLYLRIT